MINKRNFEKILKTSRSHHALAFKLAYHYKLRISDIVRLERSDFDFDNKDILIRRIVPIMVKYSNKIISIDEIINLIPIKCSRRALEIAFKRRADKAGLKACFNDLRN